MGGNLKTYRYVCHIMPAFILLSLFFLPVGRESISFTTNAASSLLWAFKLPFEPIVKDSLFHYFFFAIYLLPVGVLLSLVTLFKKDSKKLIFISTYVCLSIYLLCTLSLMVFTANGPSWFITLPVYIYIFYGLSGLGHIAMTVYGILFLKRDNEEYVEVRKLQAEDRAHDKDYHSIKTKLNVTIISTTTIILFTFMILVLNRYHTLITEAVSDIGRSIAEQAASVYEEAEGKNERIAKFFEEQKTNNSYAGSPYERIDLIIKSNADPVYVEEVTATSELPDFDVFAYTTGNPAKIQAEDKIITPALAHEIIRRYQNGTYKRQPVYDAKTQTCRYYHPVTFSRKAGHRLAGFALVVYKEEVLMEPYYKTKVFVLSMTILFLYIAIIISLILSDLIVNPILYLKKNVRYASNSIQEILSGNAKVEASSLSFEDTITTNDEVKELSTEIGNLVGLIRGIVPYISFSTLKNAEKQDSKKSQSTARELCFLFTDIRGFTTLCEGLQPREVVSILNHYLDIETEIILNNGGDVDKFVGDEMMAFFAGPRKEYNACKAAMEIRAAMRAEQQKSKEAGDSFISIGIGINTGKVVFGPVGSKTRMDFTSIGDTVNLASRLEGANKAYGSKSIITEAVYAKLHDTFICRELDFITVKGKTEPVRIYEILQKKTEAADKITEIKELFEKGLAYYRKQKWDNAEKFFTVCAQKYHDYPSIVFIDRINHFKENPPPKNWDGVFNMKVK